MQIKEKDFDKLKQLDRIEFLLRRDDIKNRHDVNFSSTYWLVCCIGLLLAFGVFCIFGRVFGLDESYFLNLAIIAQAAVKIIVIFILFEVLFIAFVSIREVKHMNKLKERYFNFKVHVKKKNGR